MVISALFINSRFFKGKSGAATYNPADGTYIPSFDQTHEGSDVTIKSGRTVTIDGSHSFDKLTIESGGVLTTTDYNRYGVDISGFEDTPAKIQKASSLLSDDGKYVFIMRGLINTAGASRTYGVTKASDSNSFAPLDAAGIKFFKPVGFTQNDGSASADDAGGYSENWYLDSNKIGDAFSNSNNTYGNPTTFTYTQTTADKFLLPFELRFVKAKITATSGDNFGIAYCDSSCGLTGSTGTDYHFINALSKPVNLASPTWSDTAVEMRTYKSWQGYQPADKFYTNEDEYQTFAKFTANFDSHMVKIMNSINENGITIHTEISDYNTSDHNTYYVVPNYDFASDPKVVLMGQDYMNFLSGSAIAVAYTSVDNQYETATADATRNRTKAVFLAASLLNSPLGCREESASLFPTLSKNLLTSLRSKLRINSINVTTVFKMEPTAKINLTGKGFAPTAVMIDGVDYGSGPGAGAGTAGASHAGYGGGSLAHITQDFSTSPVVPYDTSPGAGGSVLPGSGVSLKGLTGNAGIYYGYGGGYLNITADKVNLNGTVGTENQPMIYANGSGGNASTPIPGPSGGSIILSDSSSSGTSYEALITAVGAGVTGTTYGAGGGGIISILTTTDIVALKSRVDPQNALPDIPDSPDLKHPDVATWTGDADWFNGRPVGWWVHNSWQFKVDGLVASGGNNVTRSGAVGLVDISTMTTNKMYKLIKTITPINVVPGQASPSQITVTLEVVNFDGTELDKNTPLETLEDDFPNLGDSSAPLTPVADSLSFFGARASCSFDLNSLKCSNLQPDPATTKLIVRYRLSIPSK